MNLVRIFARPLIATGFVISGIDHLRQADAHAEALRPLWLRAQKSIPGLPDDARQAVRLNGGLMIGAGLLLGSGKATGPAALVLAAASLPHTYAQQKAAMDAHAPRQSSALSLVAKNALLVGAALMVVADSTSRSAARRRIDSAERRAVKKATKVAEQQAHQSAQEAAAALTV